MAEIRLENVRKSFGKVVAVRDLTLAVEDREFMVLLGPSGCGKTTLLRLIAGLEEADQGAVYIGGRDVTNLSPRNRQIGLVFQSYAVFPHLTVYENIAFGLRMRRIPNKEVKRRVQEGAELLQIAELLDRYPAELSGGQRQRVAVARALVVEPEVLLMDEPLSNLDAKLRLRMRTELKRLHKTVQYSIVYVTHDQVEAMSLADRVAMMHEGALLQVAAPQELYDAPANLRVAGFIGSPPMNFLPARLEERDGHIHAATADFALPLLPQQAASVKAWGRGQEVILGIRPQDLQEGGSRVEAWEGNVVEGIADVTEPLGDQILATLDTGHESLQATLPADTSARPDQPIRLRVDLSKIHLFDPNTEETIC